MTLRRQARDVLRRGAGRHRRRRLSVIVPAFNMEHYLAECLDSILAQTFRDFEIVVVDDGSTDCTGQIAADYARRHRAVRHLTSENRGLGAARNLGVGASSGDLLTFVDSDDTIPPTAFEVMLRALDESGSDFVVGSVKRHQPDGEYFHPPWLRMLHRERRLGLVASEFPEILADVFAWNKIFRRGFWERQRLAFPEGVRYEDQVLTTQAYLTARSFDVIRMPVYFWRVRDDGTSITQRRHEIEDLRDRISTKRTSLRLVQDMGTPALAQVFYDFVLCMDLPTYFQELPGCSDEYWQTLHDGVAELWCGGPPFSEAAMPVHYRLIAWLVLNDRREQAEVVAQFAEKHRPEIPLLVRDGTVVADLPYLDDQSAGIPADLYRLRDREVPWRVELAGLESDGLALLIRGVAELRRMPPTASADSDLSVALHCDGHPDIDLEVERHDPWQGDFTARLDLRHLAEQHAAGGEGTAAWTVVTCLRVGGVERSGGFLRTTVPLPSAVISELVDVEIRFDAATGLRLVHRPATDTAPCLEEPDP